MLTGLLRGIIAARGGHIAGVRSGEEVNRQRRNDELDRLDAEATRSLKQQDMRDRKLAREAEATTAAVRLGIEGRRAEEAINQTELERERNALNASYQERRLKLQEQQIKAKGGGGTKAGRKGGRAATAPRPTEQDKLMQRIRELQVRPDPTTGKAYTLEDAMARARLERGHKE